MSWAGYPELYPALKRIAFLDKEKQFSRQLPRIAAFLSQETPPSPSVLTLIKVSAVVWDTWGSRVGQKEFTNREEFPARHPEDTDYKVLM